MLELMHKKNDETRKELKDDIIKLELKISD